MLFFRSDYSFSCLERELTPSSKVVDAFPRPPTFRRSTELKRRSIDSAQLLGNMDDVQSDDPVFILRRAVAYRSSAASRHRLSAPLDEIALNHLHRDSSASSSGASEAGAEAAEETKSRQPSRQEIIAAQRAAARGNQKAMLSAQVNQLRGVDVMLPDRGMLRSQRLDVDNRMRYSYVQPDGETYDISEIIEEELGGEEPQRATSPSGTSGGDLLNGVINSTQPGDGARLIDRLLNKISEKSTVHSSSSTGTFRSTSPSTYSDDGQGRTGEFRTAGQPRRPLLPKRYSIYNTDGWEGRHVFCQSFTFSYSDCRKRSAQRDDASPPTAFNRVGNVRRFSISDCYHKHTRPVEYQFSTFITIKAPQDSEGRVWADGNACHHRIKGFPEQRASTSPSRRS